MAFIVIYDANVLYPNSLRDLIIRVAQADLVQAKWTEQILDETFRNLKANRPDLDPAKLDRTRVLMNRAVRNVLVTGYEPLIEILKLPDAGDRHVLAAAIKANAQVIVTENLNDFPADALGEWNVEAMSADEFLLDLIDLDQQAVYAQVQRMADAWKNPPGTVDDVLNSLEHLGLLGTVAALRG
ncbi:putative nucleic acid-binding protein [Kribbella orskensis]|uniref:Nucleic acid-binding protein n=1 Tax=Kribbella orskensis TaxID=2512216 RepID=A0ABY2BR53_9ACTN|nr:MULTISPECIES: PIN domain-containing protein [Kribbella]TCN37284.1 putative nucleic acid-binding protein [Kribbella sp. VKM Ac-2500]TCO27808.1 putative nucleic acid-binding protein [Kribbella orskensis]